MKRRQGRHSRFFECEKTQSPAGAPVDDPEASGGRALGCAPAGAGEMALLCGPSVRLMPQPWAAIFRLKCSNPPPGEIAVLEVCCEDGRKVLGRRALSGSDFAPSGRYRDVTVPFENDRPSNLLEARLFVRKGASLTADCLRWAPDLTAWYKKYSAPDFR